MLSRKGNWRFRPTRASSLGAESLISRIAVSNLRQSYGRFGVQGFACWGTYLLGRSYRVGCEGGIETWHARIC